MENDIEVKVGALIMEPHSGTPIVVLRGVSDETVIPIWVGTFEANAIALEIEKTVPQRPMTHDLLRNIITQMGAVVERVVITELRNDTFFALIEMRLQDGSLTVIDARPSDAIALALRFSCGIWVRPEVVSQAGSNLVSSKEEGEEIASDEWPDVITE
ncbi:MAG: bifunctional nuclease family protein [Acidobacteriota bacterium]|nr:bifunctional nuclease family protein [Acidobacteriota bacterium]